MGLAFRDGQNKPGTPSADVVADMGDDPVALADGGRGVACDELNWHLLPGRTIPDRRRGERQPGTNKPASV